MDEAFLSRVKGWIKSLKQTLPLLNKKRQRKERKGRWKERGIKIRERGRNNKSKINDM